MTDLDRIATQADRIASYQAANLAQATRIRELAAEVNRLMNQLKGQTTDGPVLPAPPSLAWEAIGKLQADVAGLNRRVEAFEKASATGVDEIWQAIDQIQDVVRRLDIDMAELARYAGPPQRVEPR